MLNLDEIWAANAAKRAELEAKEARLKAKRQAAVKAWQAECENLRPALISQAAAKAEAWLKANLIRPQELLRVEQAANGLVLHITMEDGYDEMREWEIEFLFIFKGTSPDSLLVEWANVREDRKMMESYYECDY